MKVPFVSRATHDAAVAELRSTATWCQNRVTALVDDLRAERARYDDLLAKYHTLRGLGAEPVARGRRAPAKAPAPREPDAIDTAIQEVARFDPQLRRHLIHWAAQQRATGDDVEAIAARIRSWDDGADEDDEETAG